MFTMEILKIKFPIAIEAKGQTAIAPSAFGDGLPGSSFADLNETEVFAMFAGMPGLSYVALS